MPQNSARKPRRGYRELQPPTINADAVYDERQVAGLFNVNPITIARARQSGELKSYRVGRKHVYLGQQILDWLVAGASTGRTRAVMVAEGWADNLDAA